VNGTVNVTTASRSFMVRGLIVEYLEYEELVECV